MSLKKICHRSPLRELGASIFKPSLTKLFLFVPVGFFALIQVMLNVVGKVMEKAAWIVRYITFDAHCSHAWFREAFFGNLETVKQTDLDQVPFFRNLKHRPLPKHALPFFPLQLCEYDGLPVAAIPGVCFSDVCFSTCFSSILKVYGNAGL